MSRILAVWVGREHKRDPETQLCQRYLERISRYFRIEQKVIKPLQTGSDDTIRKRESEKILETIDNRDTLIMCDERGKQLSSPELAQWMGGRFDAADRRLVFVIGGAMGVTDELRRRADFMLSLSRMTLPHALARVVLFEQIYRALSIRAGHPYHHEG